MGTSAFRHLRRKSPDFPCGCNDCSIHPFRWNCIRFPFCSIPTRCMFRCLDEGQVQLQEEGSGGNSGQSSRLFLRGLGCLSCVRSPIRKKEKQQQTDKSIFCDRCMEAIIQLSQKHMNIGGRWKKWEKGVAGLVSHRRKRLCYVGRATSSIASRLETATHAMAHFLSIITEQPGKGRFFGIAPPTCTAHA